MYALCSNNENKVQTVKSRDAKYEIDRQRVSDVFIKVEWKIEL